MYMLLAFAMRMYSFSARALTSCLPHLAYRVIATSTRIRSAAKLSLLSWLSQECALHVVAAKQCP